MNSRPSFDATDQGILSFLSENARISNREIAERLGVAEGTVRARIKRLVDEKAIRFTALTGEFEIEHPTLCYVGLRVDLNRLTDVSRALAELPEVRFVATTLGRFDVFSIVVVGSIEDLALLVSEKFMSIDGVRRSYTSIVTKTLKYDYRWGKVS